MIKFLFYFDIAVLHILGYIKYVKFWLFNHYMISAVKKNTKLIKKVRCEACYVCALGPSLKNVDLNKIDGDTIVVNRFHRMSEKFPNFIPTHYVLADAAFGSWCRNESDEAMAKYSAKGTNFIVNSRFAKLGFENQCDNLYYISNFKGEFYGQNFKLDKPTPAFSNVVGVAIGIALGMGYKKIVLLGCDFNSFASPVSNHCYTEENNERRIKLWYELYRYAIVGWGHEQFARYANKKGVKIVNSTKGSLIDAYPFEIDESLYISEV